MNFQIDNEKVAEKKEVKDQNEEDMEKEEEIGEDN